MRKAYARLIKVYRPDRSPEAFKRLHAAFESLTDGEHTREVSESEEPAEEVEAAPLAVSPEVLGSTERIIAAALAASVAFDHQDAGAKLASELRNDGAWWLAADQDRAHAELSWAIVAALAWLTPVDPLRARLLATPWAWGHDELVDRAEIDVACADALRARGGTPRELAAALVASWIAPADERSRRGKELAARMRDAPYTYLDLFGRAFKARPELARMLEARLADATAPERYEPGAVTRTMHEQISAVLGDPHNAHAKRDADSGLGLIAGLGFVSTLAALKAGYTTIGVGVVVVAIAAGSAAVLFARHAGSERERRTAARIVTRTGVTVSALGGYLEGIRAIELIGAALVRAMRDREPGLRALAAVSAWAATLAEPPG